MTAPAPTRLLLLASDADDVRLVRQNLSELPGEGFVITAVGRLADGLYELARERYDALLLSLDLQGSDGLDALRAILARAPRVPIVILSSAAREDLAIEAVRAGARDYVRKDSSKETLCRAIKGVVERDRVEEGKLAAEAQYEQSENRYRHLFEYSQGLICTHDLEGRLLSVNPAAAHSLGHESHEMIGHMLQEFVAPSVRHVVPTYFARLRNNGVAEGILRVVTKAGDERLWQYRNALYDEQGKQPYVIGYALDVTELVHARDELRRLSLTDELTGLHNRRSFFALGEQALKMAHRNHTECVLIYGDLDELKRVNDTLGHSMGSAMLADTAGILKTVFRESDIIARMGGDEFAVLAIENEVAKADLMLGRLRSKIKAFNDAGGRPYRISFSVGAAAFAAGSGLSLQQLLKRADDEMYVEKNKYRQSHVRTWTEEKE